MATRFFPFYNIDEAVGPRQPNRGDDVRLVQAIFSELSRFSGLDWIQDIPKNSRTLAMTGLFDNRLEQWITAFQVAMVPAYAAELKPDGIIDPLPPTISITPGSDTGSRQATLAFMCNHLWRHNPLGYMKIGEDLNIPWFPPAWDPDLVQIV